MCTFTIDGARFSRAGAGFSAGLLRSALAAWVLVCPAVRAAESAGVPRGTDAPVVDAARAQAVEPGASRPADMDGDVVGAPAFESRVVAPAPPAPRTVAVVPTRAVPLADAAHEDPVSVETGAARGMCAGIGVAAACGTLCGLVALPLAFVAQKPLGQTPEGNVAPPPLAITAAVAVGTATLVGVVAAPAGTAWGAIAAAAAEDSDPSAVVLGTLPGIGLTVAGASLLAASYVFRSTEPQGAAGLPGVPGKLPDSSLSMSLLVAGGGLILATAPAIGIGATLADRAARASAHAPAAHDVTPPPPPMPF